MSYTDSGFEYTYTSNPNVATLKTYLGTATTVNISQRITVNGTTYNVTAIGNRAFYENALTSITIPEGITTIGQYAFYDCEGLSSVSFPASLTRIGDNAFQYCDGISTISFPPSSLLTTIGNYAFNYCQGLSSVSFPASLTTIGNYVFQLCSKLSTILFPPSSLLTTIGEYAFGNCYVLSPISLPSSLTTISEGAFFFCTGLTTISFPSSLTTIGNDAFNGCTGLSTISFLPSSLLTTIGASAFWYCQELLPISLPSSLKTIGYFAFWYCTKLSSATLYSTTSYEAAFESRTSIIIVNNIVNVVISKYNNIQYTGSVLTPTFDGIPNDPDIRFVTYPATVQNVRKYTVTSITSVNYSYTLPSDNTFNVTPITLSISFSDLTYNGSVQTPTFANNPRDTNLVIDPREVLLVGSYTVNTVTSDNYVYSLTGSQFKMLPKAYGNLVLNNTTVAYDGNSHVATIDPSTPGPSGETITLGYYDPSTKDQILRPTAIGMYNIAATSPNYSYTVSPSQLQITRGTWPVTLAYLSTASYNGSSQNPAVTSDFLSNLPSTDRSIQFIYNDAQGRPTSPVARGIYTITSAQSSNYNFNLPATPTFTIEKGLYGTPLVLSGLIQNYSSGVTRNVTATNGPPGETIVFSYTQNGVIVTPINIGTYTVAGANSDNYTYTLPVATLQITPATFVLTFSSASPQYNGVSQNITATNIPSDETGITYTYSQNGASVIPLNAGTYTVASATSVSGKYNYTLGTNQFTIAQNTSVTLGITVVRFPYSGVVPTVAALGLTRVPVGETPFVTYNAPPIAVGTYSITSVTSANYIYNLNASIQIWTSEYSFTVATPQNGYNAGAAVPATVSFQNSNYTGTVYYTGVNVTYPNTSSPPRNIGTYVLNVVSSSPNYVLVAQGSALYIITPTVVYFDFTPGTLLRTYNPNGTQVSYSAIPPADPGAKYRTSLLYNNQSAIPVNVGTYGVSVVVDPLQNYIGSESGTLTIGPQWVTITFSNLTQTYTGQPLSVIATPNFPRQLIVLYNGLTKLPTDAGQYTVYAFVDQTFSLNYVGNATATLTIQKAPATVTLNNLSRSYTGEGINPTAITNPLNLRVDFTYSGSSVSPVIVGDYNVTGNINDKNYAGSNSGILSITIATGYVTLFDLTQNYTGNPLSTGIITYPYGLSTSITYDGSNTPPTNPGNYIVGGVIHDHNYQGFGYNIFTIPKKPATISIDNLIKTYTGSAISMTYTTVPPNLNAIVLYSGVSQLPSSVGLYNVSATIDDPYYKGTFTSTLTIAKAPAQIIFTTLAPMYANTFLSTTVETVPPGLYVDINYTQFGSNTLPFYVGNYTAIANISDMSYYGMLSTTFTVQYASTPITFLSTSAEYDGQSHEVLAYPTPSNLFVGLTYYNSTNLKKVIATPSNVGNYAVLASVLYDSNYGGSVLSSFTITKGVGTVNFPFKSYNVPYGAPSNIIPTVTPKYKNLVIEYLYSSIQYAFTTTPPYLGTYTLYGTIADTNWAGVGSTIVNVVKGNATIRFPSTSAHYNGRQLPIPVITQPANLSTVILYNGYTTAPTDIQTYAVTASVDDLLWEGSATLSNYQIVRGLPFIQTSSAVTQFGIPYIPSTLVIPTTLTPSYIYDSSNYFGSVAPSNAGTYRVITTVDTPLYYGSNTSSLEIRPFPEPVYIAGLTQLYTGGPVTPRVVTDIPDIPTKYLYSDRMDGKPLPWPVCGIDIASPYTIPYAPADLGTYIVGATLTDPNYVGKSCQYFSIVVGPPISLTAYPVNQGAVLVWTAPTAPTAPTALQYTVSVIPPVVSSFTTSDTFTHVSTLQNGTEYMFTVTAKTSKSTGLTTQATISPWAGTGYAGLLDDEEALAQFDTPSDVAFDSAGNLYIADTNNGAIRKMNGYGTVTTIQRNCGRPQGIAIDEHDTIYVSDALNHVIYKLAGRSDPVVFAGTLGVAGRSNGTPATFNTPLGLAYANGTLYVADSGNHMIRTIDMSADVDTLAGAGVAGSLDAQGKNAEFNTPSGIVRDVLGNIYVADTGNHRIRKIDASFAHNVTTIVGSTAGYMDIGKALFSAPARLALDPLQNLYITDTHCIRILNTNGQVTTSVGFLKPGNTNGLGTYATLNVPLGMVWDKRMNLYVADSGNHQIRIVTFNPIARVTPNPSANYLPAPPYNLSAIGNPLSIFLSWSSATQTIFPLSGYRIYVNGNNIYVGPDATSVTIPNLTPNTSYTLYIYAVNIFGESAGISLTTSTTADTVGFLFGGTTQFYTSSTITVETRTIPADLPVFTTYSLNGTPIAVPSSIGTYNGIASVASGSYVGSAGFTLSIIDPRPGPVTHLTAEPQNRRVALSWIPPTIIAITNFTVTTADIPPITTFNNFTSSLVVSDLTNGIKYSFSVVANNFYGSSAPTTVDATPIGAPTAPLNIVPIVTARSSIQISWNPPVNSGGLPITSYIIQPNTPNQTTASVTIDRSPYEFVTGLRGGFPYVFIVRAVNAAGIGDASVASASIVPLTTPEKPTVSAIRGYQKATVSWSIPSNGGLPITSFVIQTSPATRIYQTSDGVTSQYEIYGLNDTVTYSFSVYGVNSFGNGATGVSPFVVPKPPAPKRGNRPSWFGQ
jgi:sugar lactone lactonase YvrE